MKVVTKLRGAFALYITLLALLLTYHVTTIQGIVNTGQELIQISSRVRATSIEQVARIPQLSENAAKYWVTRDTGYFDKFSQLAEEYSAELSRLDALPLSQMEREEFTRLTSAWSNLGDPIERLKRVAGGLGWLGQSALTTLQEDLDSVMIYTQSVGEASQAVMASQLESSASKARAAERLSWISAFGVLLFSIMISALIARSISEPLKRLTVGTNEVAAGQFDYRLDTTGDNEFAQVARDFNTMTERLGELDQMKRDFVSKVSHDLKTPLSSMQETINLMLDEVSGPLTDQQRRLLVLHQNSAERLSSMLAKLLDLSRLEAGIEPDINMVAAAQLIDRAISQVEVAAEERGLEIVTSLPDQSVLLECDADRMLQLIDNLLENAIKFSPRGGTIRISLHTLHTRPPEITQDRWNAIRTPEAPVRALLLTVSDNGPGIPNDQKERIFSRFYQAEAGRSVKSRGVGLGLTICQEIVSTHGGVIWVSDNVDGGSVFNVLLPGALAVPNAQPLEQV